MQLSILNKPLLALTASTLACLASAQTAKIGSRAPGLEGLKWLRPLSPDSAGRLTLFSFMPQSRWQYVRALRSLDSLGQEFAGQLGVAAVLNESNRKFAAIKLRSSGATVHLAIDDHDRFRNSLDPGALSRTLAHAILLDHNGVLLWFGELRDEMRYMIADVASNELAIEDLCRMHSAQRSGSKDGVVANLECDATHGVADDLPSGSWLAWEETFAKIKHRRGNKEALRLLLEAGEALRSRPDSLARVFNLAMERFPNALLESGMDDFVLEVIGAATDPAGALLGFSWHAHRHEDDLARGFAVRFLDLYKGVPSRLSQFHGRLARARYARRFVKEQLLALNLVLQAEPRQGHALQMKFELLIAGIDKPSAAMRVGRDLIDARRGDPSFLNSFAWRLLTEEPFKGRMNLLALEAVNVMRNLENWQNYWRLDTLALALYENGELDEAVRIQEEALASCEPGSQGRYAQRLERYRMAAAAAAPPK